MSDPAIHSAFETLRHPCVQLTRQHTVDNVIQMLNMLKTIEPSALQDLQEYVLFPVRLLLKQSHNRSEEFQIKVLECLLFILDYTEVKSWQLFEELFSFMCIIISVVTEERVAALCEEQKLAVVKVFSALMRQTDMSVLMNVYTPQFLPPLGHAVSTLLHLAQTEKLRDLRVAAMHAVLDLTSNDRKYMTVKQNTQIANAFASFLPGILIAMTKVATGDPKQGQMVTVAAIKVWKAVSCLDLNDENLATEKPVSSSNEPEETKQKQLVVRRTKDWVKSTALKVKTLITQMASIRNHQVWKVRLAMVDWAACLLTNCMQSLEPCLATLLEVLVNGVSDSFTQVSDTSKAALTSFEKTVTTSDMKPLVEILEENLHSLAMKLPGLMRTSDDDTKYSTLNLLNGYLKLLGPHIKNFTLSSSHLQHLTLALIQILELDCSGIKIIQEQNLGTPFTELDIRQGTGSWKKVFKHFHDEKVYEGLITTCRLLGYYGDIEILVDHLLDKFFHSSLHRKQSALIVNQMLLGTTGTATTTMNKERMKCLVRSLQEEYLELEYWNVAMTTHSSKEDFLANSAHIQNVLMVQSAPRFGTSIEQANSNVLQVCCLLEGIGTFAEVLGTDYKYLMVDVLYPVMEKLGNSNYLVVQTAYSALESIAKACECRSIQELIFSNVDYLINSISIQLRHLSVNPTAPLVFQVAISYSDHNLLPIISDTVTDMIETLDAQHSDQALLFLKVLHTLAVSIQAWFTLANPEHHDSKDESSCTEDDSAHRLVEYLKAYHRQKLIASGELEEEGEEEYPSQDNSDIWEEDKPKQIPCHVKVIMEVLDRCVHMLAAPDTRVRLLTLDCVGGCVKALQAHQDHLLPQIHKLWPAFLLRFSEEEQLVIIKALEVLKVMGDISKDFIRQRVEKDVLNHFIKMLVKLSSTSVRAGPTYRYTIACRTQLAILNSIGPLFVQIEVGDEYVGGMLSACAAYLSCHQPLVLQQAAMCVYKMFWKKNPDHVWLELSSVYSCSIRDPPHPCFRKLQILGSQERTEFSDNIKLLLEKLLPS